MSDAKFAALLSLVLAFGGGLAAFARWALPRLAKVWDEFMEIHRKGVDAHVAFAAAASAHAAKLDTVFRYVVDHTPPMDASPPPAAAAAPLFIADDETTREITPLQPRIPRVVKRELAVRHRKP